MRLAYVGPTIASDAACEYWLLFVLVLRRQVDKECKCCSVVSESHPLDAR